MELRKPSSLLSPSTTLNVVNTNNNSSNNNNASNNQNNGTSTSNQKVPYLPGAHHQLAGENQKLSNTTAAHGFNSSVMPSDEKAGYAVAATIG